MDRKERTRWIGKARHQAITTGLLALMTLCVTPGVLAGETLHLKTGAVDTRLMQTTRQSLLRGRASKARFFVVQFKTPISPEDRKNLTTLGAKIVRYLPDDALVIDASNKIAATIVHSSNNVHVVVPFQASWKISPEFEPVSVFNRNDEQEVLIRLFPQEDGKQMLTRLNAMSKVQFVAGSGRSLVVRVARADLDQLARLDGVEWLQPNPKMELLYLANEEGENSETPITAGDYKDITGYESGTKLMNFEVAWKKGLTGKGQIIAMADTGLDKGDIPSLHSDFNGRVPVGYAFGMFAKSWEDPMGHGTHVAGSVLGGGVASQGLLKGAAYDASLVAEGMWSPMLGNLTVPPKLRDLFDKAYQAGARVHTNSWGNPRSLGAYDGFAQQVDEYMFANPDMLLVFSAGNSGVDANKDGRIDAASVSSPGTAKNVLTVGASKNYVMNGGIQKKLKELRTGQENWGAEPLASSMLSENAQGLAPFSSRGPTQDGRLKPEVVAPGTNILSVRSQHPQAELLWGEYNKDYVWSGGTSMSAPLVAGAVAVVRQYLIEDRKIANPSAALMKAVLMHSAFDLYPGQFGEIGKAAGQEILNRRPNTDEGYGRVDLARATDLGGALIVDERAGLATGETHSYPLRVSGRSRITVTLVYTDAPAAANASKSLVNDLDLVLIDSSGKQISLNDHVNNSEMIELDGVTGDIEVRVKGTNVPQGLNGKQPYALVLSLH